ncbi:FAD-dependent oxidoreductase [Aspergillus fumigatus Af293]|uniref:Monooxygenase, putative n=1 Tax=Aspergillus fumigatus (strain ATCC MYA-4609 / CBS 101355 / FGSC A1100 / Af293) TaxID=330879 RepID=Q4W982_ASPFU|nr:monooxygenase, putative [Aspergillus fumigatus Af293]EAL84359.1 monooxygenase, putative [Aspergillus fumigatus Af293]
MALHSSLPYLDSILPSDLRAKLNSTTTNPWAEPDPTIAAAIPFVNGATGELMAKIPMPSPKRVIRGKLRDLLRTGVEVRFGRRLTDIRVEDDGVIAVFDGEEVRGNVLVGADGAWCEGDSSTRTLPRCRSRTSWSWWVPRHPFSRECAKEERKNAFPSFTREQALFIHGKSHPIVQLAPHPHQKTSIFSNVANVVDPVRPETWVFHYCLSIWTADDAPETAEERRALFKHYMSQYCEPYRSAGEWLSQATPIRAEKFHYWKNITRWRNFGGKVTLAGDAAHPMVPFTAQGLNTALEDVKRFLDAIVKVVYHGADMQTEMDAYDDSAYTRGKRDINLSVEQMHAYHHWEEIMTSPLMKGGYGALINSSPH